MLENKMRSKFQSYSISFLTFSITHCKRGFIFGQKALLYQVEMAQLQVPLPAGYKQRASWGDQGPRYTCVCIYRLCTTAPEALAPTSGGELLAEQWFRNISTHRGCCCTAGPIQDKHLQEMLQF